MNLSALMARRATTLLWLRRLAIALAIAAIAHQWINTRISILRVNQTGPNPTILATYYIYHSMATGMREGRIGQVDLLAVRQYSLLNNPSAEYQRLPPGAEHQWVPYYTLDVGYSFIVEAARLLFPTLPDNHLRSLALQLVADAALVVFVWFVFSHWNFWLGLLAAYLYCSNGVFYDLVSFAFYYYWDIPLTFFVIGAIILAYHRPDERTLWLAAAGFILGFGVWLRGSWWPLSLYLLVVAAMTPTLRRHLVVAVIAFAILGVPEVVRASRARGTLTFTTRAVWHVALVGLGYYPNPYGLEASDGVIFKLTKDKYGVEFRSEDYWVHDQAARKEFFKIWQQDRAFVIRSFLGRLGESIASHTQTSVLSFLFLSNVTYRVLCLISFFVMVWRGGEKRVVALASAGCYAIYVVLTSVFYFVGLAYDNVSEVTLFALFIGGIDSILVAARHLATTVQMPAVVSEFVSRSGSRA